MELVVNWKVPTNNYLEAIATALQNEVTSISDLVLKGYATTEFRKCTRQFLDDFISRLVQEQDKTNGHFHHIESFRPMTRNDAMSQYEAEELVAFREERFKHFASQHFDREEKQSKKDLGPVDRQKRMDKPGFRESLGSDPFDAEVKLIAKVSGYYLVAARRFIDNVNNSMRADLLYRLETGVRRELRQIIPRDPDIVANRREAARLLAQDPHTEAQRLRLIKQKEKLVEARTCLDRLAAKYQAPVDSQSSGEEMEVDSDTS